MIKKYGLWYAIKYYYILQFAFLGFILFFSKDYLLYFICVSQKIAYGNFLYKAWSVILAIGLLILWLFPVFHICREKSYRFQTGRNFSYDHNKFHRTYYELVDYFKDADPHKLNTEFFPVMKWRDKKGLIFGTENNRLISIPSNSECNIAVFGPPGSGKTSGIAIINAMQFEGSVLAVDVKGDLYNYVSKHSNRKIVRFCPDSPTALRDSCRFNPLAGINTTDSTDKKLYLENMSIVLIPDEGGNEGTYFSSRARKLFQGIAHLLLFKNPNTSFPDIIHAILQGNVFDWVIQVVNSECEVAKELLASFYGNNEKNVSGAYDTLTTALVHFSNPVLDVLLSNSGNCISIHTLEKGWDLYLQISQEHLDAYAPLFTLLIQNMSTAFTRRPDTSTGAKNRPILMLLDEFPQLTFSYKLINSNLSTLRSKSVILMIIQQNLSQLEYRYQNTGARSILGNCNYQIILGSNDINSSKIFSDTFGNKKVLKICNTQTIADTNTFSRSIQEATEKIFPPEYFGDLSSDNKAILYFKGKYTECEKLNCYKQEKKTNKLSFFRK